MRGATGAQHMHTVCVWGTLQGASIYAYKGVLGIAKGGWKMLGVLVRYGTSVRVYTHLGGCAVALLGYEAP